MRVSDLKEKIKEVTLKEYKLKTNFSSAEFLVELGSYIIIAKPICTQKEVRYEFMLDTQFLSSKEILYNDVVMIKNVIEILEENRTIAISRLKKWTVEGFLKDKKEREERSEAMLEALKNAFRSGAFMSDI